jgi:hypothetical protein
MVSLPARFHRGLHPHLGRWLLSGLLGIAGVLLSASSSAAIFEETVILLTRPLNVVEVARLRSGDLPAGESVVTEGTISQTSLTLPSLWWTEQQFGGRLLDYWVAYTGTDRDQPRRVDLLINQQVWTQYNYLERYGFLEKFGRAASDFGYSTRIFNWRGDLLGAYICEFPDASLDATVIANRCQVFLDATGRGALSGIGQPGAPLPINGGTGQ